MPQQPEALRLADALVYWHGLDSVEYDAAAELRRLHTENERLAAEVANRNRRALAGDEAVSALANVHAYYEGLEAQRDALLEALREIGKYTGEGPTYTTPWQDIVAHLGQTARAAIALCEGPVAAVEETK